MVHGVKYSQFKIIKGGAGVMEAVIHKGVITTNSADQIKKQKTDWEELTDLCYSSAQKSGLTYEQAQKTLKHIRKLLDGRCR